MLFKVLRQQRKLHRPIFTVRVMSCLTTKIIIEKMNIFLTDYLISLSWKLKLHTLYLRTIGERSVAVARGGGKYF